MKKHLKKVSVITVLLTVLLSLHLAPGASAQVSVQGNNLSAVQIIEQIQKATDYIFFYIIEGEHFQLREFHPPTISGRTPIVLYF